MQTEPQNSPIEHQQVPIEHRGLHDFLYSSADEHAPLPAVMPQVNQAAADALLPIEDWCTEVGDAKIAGVYGVFDRDRQLQYVTLSRHVSLALRGHKTQLGEELCAFVRVQAFGFPKRDEMLAVQQAWIEAWVEATGVMPIGNSDPDSLWSQTTGEAAIAAMSPAEREAYEAKKLKLRKAMADSSLSREQPIVKEVEPGSAIEPIVAEDDWSRVIQTQTQDTL
jgi:hypothetical protein